MASNSGVVIRDKKGDARFRLGRPYKRGEKWYGRVTNLRSGKRTIVTPPSPTEKKALEASGDWCQSRLRQEQSDEPDQRKPMLFEDLFEQWLKTLDIRESTRRDYEASFKGIYRPAFTDMIVDEIIVDNIERLLVRLQKRGASPRTRQKHLTTLRSFLNWCALHGHIDREKNPTLGLKVKRAPKRKGKALAEEEAHRLLVACRKNTVLELEDSRRQGWRQSWSPPSHLALAVHIALLTGLRRGNVVRLTWGQIDLPKARISISAEQMKADEDHEVPIHPELVGMFREILHDRRKRPSLDELVLGIEVREIRKSFLSALKRADLPPMRWHDLRHTTATWLSTRCSYACLKTLLGHTLPGVTGDYVHVPWPERVAAISSLPCLLKNTDVEAIAEKTP